MTKSNFVTIGKVLTSSNGGLQNLAQGAERILKYDAMVRQWLSAPLCEHVWVANVEDGRMVLHTDSSAWSARLRYCLPRLKDKLEAHNIQSIRILTQPKTAKN